MSDLDAIRERVEDVKASLGGPGATGLVWGALYVEDVERLLAEAEQACYLDGVSIEEWQAMARAEKAENERLRAIAEAARQYREQVHPNWGDVDETSAAEELDAALSRLTATEERSGLADDANFFPPRDLADATEDTHPIGTIPTETHTPDTADESSAQSWHEYLDESHLDGSCGCPTSE